MVLRKTGKRFQKIVYEQIPQQKLLFRKYPVGFFIFLIVLVRSSEAIVAHLAKKSEYNYGLAFSLPIHSISAFLVGLTGIGIIIFLLKSLRSRLFYPCMLMLAGGVNNALERIMSGGVRDTLYIGSWNGNVADILILYGMLWALYVIFSHKVEYAK